ncbi:MAG: hypothetical protein ACFCVB_02375 [Nodosilinea sp.]
MTTEGTFPVDMMRHNQANPGFVDGLQSVADGRELPADAPAVSIFRDGNLEFYRDSEQTYMSPTLREILTDTQVASPQQSQDRAEELVITIVPLSQAEAVAGQNSGDSSLSDPTLVAEQATTPKVIKDAVTGEIKGLDGPGESALDVPAKIADRQADETRISTGSSSTGGSSAGSDPPSDELGGHSLAVSSFLSWVMNSCYDPSGGPAQVIGDDYIVNRGQGGSITLTAKDERGVIFAVNGGGEIGQNDLKPQDFERLRFIESTASQRLQRPTINPPRIGRSREIELE